MQGIRVNVRPDTLDAENRKFDQRALGQPVFLNSVPKSGSHLLRNIMRMFVPVEQQYQAEFIQAQMLREHLAAFIDDRNFLSWGHLMFTDKTAVAVGRLRHILLVRDPYDWVLAQARFFLSEEFQGGLEFLNDGTLKVDAVLNMMIFGIAEKTPPMASTFVYNALAWLGTGAHLFRYEDMLAALADLDGPQGEQFFGELFAACGVDRPVDWRDRVRIGADRKQSGTARENLTGIQVEIPAELPALQRRMVDLAAPGLRELLGYPRTK